MFYHLSTFFTFGSIVETILGRSLWMFGPSNWSLRLLRMIFSSSQVQNIQKLIKLSTSSSAKRIVNEMKSSPVRRAFSRKNSPSRQLSNSSTSAVSYHTLPRCNTNFTLHHFSAAAVRVLHAFFSCLLRVCVCERERISCF